MKKTIKSRIKKRYDQAGEDMRILQHMIAINATFREEL